MNYLAHLYMSYPSPPLMAGNFLADKLKRSEKVNMPDDILMGVEMHYEIDSKTDAHSAFREMRKIYEERHGRYAPVVTDVMVDYQLATHWPLRERPLSEFCKYVYESFLPLVKTLSGYPSYQLNRLLTYRWLMDYSSLSGIQKILFQLQCRAKFGGDFTKAINLYTENHQVLDKLADELITDIKSSTTHWHNKLL